MTKFIEKKQPKNKSEKPRRANKTKKLTDAEKAIKIQNIIKELNTLNKVSDKVNDFDHNRLISLINIIKQISPRFKIDKPEFQVKINCIENYKNNISQSIAKIVTKLEQYKPIIEQFNYTINNFKNINPELITKIDNKLYFQGYTIQLSERQKNNPLELLLRKITTSEKAPNQMNMNFTIPLNKIIQEFNTILNDVKTMQLSVSNSNEKFEPIKIKYFTQYASLFDSFFIYLKKTKNLSAFKYDLSNYEIRDLSKTLRQKYSEHYHYINKLDTLNNPMQAFLKDLINRIHQMKNQLTKKQIQKNKDKQKISEKHQKINLKDELIDISNKQSLDIKQSEYFIDNSDTKIKIKDEYQYYHDSTIQLKDFCQ